jgi:outer membrane protein TolC
MMRNQVRSRVRAGFVLTFTTALAGAVFGEAAGQVVAQGAEPTVTLQQAIELALQHSPTMAQRLGAVRTSESAERTSFGAFLPSLSLSSGAGLSSSSRFDPATQRTVTGSSESYTAGLSSGIDVYTGGRRGAQLDAARAGTAEAEAGLIEQRFAVALQAKQSYFNVLRAEETVRVSQARIERAEQGLRAAEVRLMAGATTRSDSLRAQLELTQARQALLSAQNQRRAATYTLGALVGIDGPANAEPLPSLEPEALAVTDDEFRRLAVESSPTVVSSEASVRAADASLRANRAQYLPTLRASGGYDWSNQAASFSGGRTGWSTRLSLSYPLFNNFSREDANERAEVALNNARITLADAQRQVLAQVQQAIDAVRLAEEQIALTIEAERVAAEDLRVQETRYSLGASTILDLITSQIALVEAELNRINARYDYQVALAELESLIGRELR